MSQRSAVRSGRDTRLLRATLVLAGAFACAFCLGVAAHELGHVAAIRLAGIRDVRAVLHPFAASYTVWRPDPALVGIVDAAGPLGNVLAGTVVMVALWRWRRASLLPLIAWGPVSYVQEGLNGLLQLALRERGTDWMNMLAAGVPQGAMIAVGALLLALGVAVLCALLPLLGLWPTDSYPRRWGVVVPGLAAYVLAMLVYEALLARDQVVRGAALLVFAVLLGTVVAALYRPLRKPIGRVARVEGTSPSWRAATSALAWAAVIIAAGLLLHNG